LLRELTDALTTKFERPVLDAKANYWIHSYDVLTTSGQAEYRLPQRAIGLSKVELGGPNTPSNGFVRLPQTSEDNINVFQTPAASLSQPQRWVLRGDQVVLFPTPDNGGYTLRIWYYVRPSRLTLTQTSTFGQITAINYNTGAVTIGGLFVGYDSAYAPVAFAANSSRFDIIAPGAWHELKVVDATCSTVTFPTFTFDPSLLGDVVVGDVVRYGDNSEWPQIPEDYHRTLIDIASVKILVQRDLLSSGKAGGYAQDASIDIQRFANMIAQRVQEEPAVYRADLPSLRNYRYWGGGWA
jgi:hypothetical protein